MTDALWRVPSFHVETAHLRSSRTGLGPRWRHTTAARCGTLQREAASARPHPKVQAPKGIKLQAQAPQHGKVGCQFSSRNSPETLSLGRKKEREDSRGLSRVRWKGPAYLRGRATFPFL